MLEYLYILCISIAASPSATIVRSLLHMKIFSSLLDYCFLFIFLSLIISFLFLPFPLLLSQLNLTHNMTIDMFMYVKKDLEVVASNTCAHTHAADDSHCQLTKRARAPLLLLFSVFFFFSVGLFNFTHKHIHGYTCTYMMHGSPLLYGEIIQSYLNYLNTSIIRTC